MFGGIKYQPITTDAAPDVQQQRLLAAMAARRKMAESGMVDGGRRREQAQAPFVPQNAGQLALGLGAVGLGEFLQNYKQAEEQKQVAQGQLAGAKASASVIRSLGGQFANLTDGQLTGLALGNPAAFQELTKKAIEFQTRAPADRYEMFTLQDGRQAQRNVNTGKVDVLPEGRAPMQVAPGGVVLDPRTNQPLYIAPEKPDVLSPDAEAQKMRLAQASRAQTTINNNMQGETEFAKKAAGLQAERFGKLVTAGEAASGNANNFKVLRELNKVAPTGVIQGGWAEMFPAFAGQPAGQAFMAIVKQIAPTLRVEGSGATSDMETRMFLESLPRLRNDPRTNEALIGFMERKAQIDMERGSLARQAFQPDITPQKRAEIEARMDQLNQASILTPESRQALGIPDPQDQQATQSMQPAPSPAPAAPAPAPSTPELPRIASPEDFQKLPSGTEFIAPDGSVRVKP